MKKIKLNQVFAALIMICLVTFSGLDNVSAVNSTVRELKGKVVFQNDKTPVPGGNIEVFLYSDDDESGKLIESVSINSNGEFILTQVNGIQSERIKIMCYPNDLDNFNAGFKSTEIKLSDAKNSSNKVFDLIIEVKRAGSEDKQD